MKNTRIARLRKSKLVKKIVGASTVVALVCPLVIGAVNALANTEASEPATANVVQENQYPTLGHVSPDYPEGDYSFSGIDTINNVGDAFLSNGIDITRMNQAYMEFAGAVDDFKFIGGPWLLVLTTYNLMIDEYNILVAQLNELITPPTVVMYGVRAIYENGEQIYYSSGTAEDGTSVTAQAPELEGYTLTSESSQTANISEGYVFIFNYTTNNGVIHYQDLDLSGAILAANRFGSLLEAQFTAESWAKMQSDFINPHTGINRMTTILNIANGSHNPEVPQGTEEQAQDDLDNVVKLVNELMNNLVKTDGSATHANENLNWTEFEDLFAKLSALAEDEFASVEDYHHANLFLDNGKAYRAIPTMDQWNIDNWVSGILPVYERAINYVKVTAVSLDESAFTLTPGDSLQVIATVTPDSATDKTIVWTSSDSEIASVDENGVIVAGDKLGTAIITATSSTPNVFAEVHVSVTEDGQALTVADINLTEARKVYNKYKGLLEEQYTPESWKAMQQHVTNSKAVDILETWLSKDPAFELSTSLEMIQGAIDTSIELLNGAMSKLVKAPTENKDLDLTKLQAVYDSIGDKNQYTEKSWKEFIDDSVKWEKGFWLAEAKRLLIGKDVDWDNLDQAYIDKIAKGLQSTIDTILVKKDNNGGNGNNSGNGSNQGNGNNGSTNVNNQNNNSSGSNHSDGTTNAGKPSSDKKLPETGEKETFAMFLSGLAALVLTMSSFVRKHEDSL